MALKLLTVLPRAKHTATVIFAHGLGDTGEGWKFMGDTFRTDKDLQHIKWIFPHAPIQSVTANMGMSMPSWFDIYSFGFDGREDEDGMLNTVRSLNEIITQEVDSGIDASRIVIGGFSQGGAMSILTGVTSERKLAGIIALSGWLPLKLKFGSMATAAGKSTPIFWGHGRDDPLVKFAFGESSVKFLRELGVAEGDEGISFHAYPGMGHSACPEEIADIQKWIKRVIPTV